MGIPSIRTFFLICILPWAISGCHDRESKPHYPVDRLHPEFITLPKWNLGKAEISTYRLKMDSSLSMGDSTVPKQEIDTLVISLTKHPFDTKTLHKANDMDQKTTIEAFLMVQLIGKDRLNTGSNKTTTLQFGKSNLQPYKMTLSRSSYEGSTFVEQQFHLKESRIDQFWLGDGVEGKKTSLGYERAYYPLEQIPFLIRALDFEKQPAYTLPFLTQKMEVPILVAPFVGDHVFELVFTKVGEERLYFHGMPVMADVVQVAYPDDIFPPVKTMGGLIATLETYWISKTPERLLIQVTGQTGTFKKDHIKAQGSFQLDLLDTLNIDWWNKGENFDLRPLFTENQQLYHDRS